MMYFFLIGLTSSLMFSDRSDIIEVEKEEQEEQEYDMCSQISEDRERPWRVRALCNDDNTDRLEDYLEVSRLHSASLALDEVSKPKKREGRGKKKKRRGRRGRGGGGGVKEEEGGIIAPIPPSETSSLIYEGHYCAQGDHSSGTPIVNFTYGIKEVNKSFDTHFKIHSVTPPAINTKSVCYSLDCNGRCDLVDPSVQFECTAGKNNEQKDANNQTETNRSKFNILKATWFVSGSCVSTTKKDSNDTADGEYFYTQDQVKLINSGQQGRFCWETGVESQEDEIQENMEMKPLAENYYYSVSSDQKLPECPP